MVGTEVFRGLTAEVTLNGTTANEYGYDVSHGDTTNQSEEGTAPTSPHSRTRNRSVKVETHIESVTDSKAGMKINIPRDFVGLESCDGIRVLVYSDGTKLTQSDIRMSTLRKYFQDTNAQAWTKEWEAVTRTDKGQRVACPIQFEAASLDEWHDHPAPKHMGKIELFFFAMNWVAKTRPITPNPRRRFPTTLGVSKGMRSTKEPRKATIDQASLNQSGATHGLVFGKGLKLSSQARIPHTDQPKGARNNQNHKKQYGTWKHINPYKEPFFEVCFKYRSLEALRALGFEPV